MTESEKRNLLQDRDRLCEIWVAVFSNCQGDEGRSALAACDRLLARCESILRREGVAFD